MIEKPILVSCQGRSGSTALMALLASSPKVALDRLYPFENRYLTYLAKTALLLGRRSYHTEAADDRYTLFAYNAPTGMQWVVNQPDVTIPGDHDWFAALWPVVVKRYAASHPKATYYTEKCPYWVPAEVRQTVPCLTVCLFRDPRDQYISAIQFFRRTLGDAAPDKKQDPVMMAIKLAWESVLFYENWRDQRHRADVLMVRYEDLIENRYAIVDRLNRFTGLRLDPNAGQEHAATHKTAASVKDSVGRWRKDEFPASARTVFERVMHEALTDLGYPTGDPGQPPFVIPNPVGKLASAKAVQRSGDCKLTDAGGALQQAVKGNNPWFTLPIDPFPAAAVREVWACVHGTVGATSSLYWHGPGEEFHETRSAHIPFYPGRHWQVVRFRLDLLKLWTGTVAGLRLDLGKGGGPSASGTFTIRWIRPVAAV